MTDNVKNTTVPQIQDTSANVSQDTPSNPSPKSPSTKPVNTAAKAKKGRRTRRRRVATSDAGSASESETGVAENGDSASSDSDQSADDASDDDDDGPSLKTTTTADAPQPVFGDVNSTTPAVWAEGAEAKGDAISFSEFKADESAAGRGRGRGRGGVVERGKGRGAFTVNGERRELTEAEKEKLAAKRAKQKEKFKAKKEAKKQEAKIARLAKEATASTTDPSAPKAESTDVDAPPTDSLVASTSALTIEDPAATTPPTPSVAVLDDEAIADTAKGSHRSNRINNREAYAERIAADPKFTPRVGNFWTHDQRLYEGGTVGEGGYAGLRQMSDFWRGRAVPRGFRGFRGRGAPNGFPGAFRGRGGRFPPAELHVPKQEERGSGLEMDKLERELEEKRERVRAARAAAEETPIAAASGTQAEGQQVEADGEPAVVSPQLAAVLQDRPPVAPSGNKWGHEAYEAIQASEPQVRPFNPLLRGRGRGRGGFRGFPHPHPGAFGPPRPPHPAANGPGPQQPREAPPSARPESRAAEASSTAPAAESLLSSTASFTVRLPGAVAAEAVPAIAPVAESPPLAKPARSTTSSSRSPAPTAAPFVPAHQQLPFDVNGHPAQQASPVPYLAQHDTGSVSSGHFSQQHTGYGPPSAAPVPQIPIPAEYFAQASPMPRVMPPQPHNPYMPNGRPYPYYPQDFQPRSSFSAPVPAASPPVFYPQHSNQGSYDARSASPFPPQQLQMVEGGYFVPPQRGQKVSIRAPKAKDAPDGTAEYANVNASTPYFDANGQAVPFNPYAGQAMQGEEAYFAQNGRYWQGGNGYEVPAYGYDTYQGY